jgi:hypothetical protein
MPATGLTLALGLAMQTGGPGPSEMPNYPALPEAYNQYGFEGRFEQRYPFDNQQNWVHGYFQEIPAYGGHAFYRPYNYKDVLSQSQTAAGWGQSPTLPYSQQFWHRYHDQATMLKLSRTTPSMQSGAASTAVTPAGSWGVPVQPGATIMAPGYGPPAGYLPAQSMPLSTMPVQQPVYYSSPVLTVPPQHQ